MVIVTCIVLTTYCKPGIWLDVWVLMATLSIFVLSPVVSVNREILEREVSMQKIAFVIRWYLQVFIFVWGLGDIIGLQCALLLGLY